MSDENEAQEEQPLVLLDGTLVFPSGKIVDRAKQKTDLVQGIKAGTRKAQLKTTIADIPVDMKAANALTTLVTYQLIGLSNEDIAFLLNVDISQIDEVVKSNDFQMMKNFLVDRIYEVEKDDARAILAQHAPLAAAKMVNTIAENGALGYMAAKDVLSLQRIHENPKDNSLRTLEIVVMRKEDVDKRSVENITITIPT